MVRGGEPEAFGELFRRHSAGATIVARSMLRSEQDADDAVSESFERVLHILRRGGGPADLFRPYLFQVVRNACTSRHRRRLRRAEVRIDEDVLVGDNTEGIAESAAASRAFRSLSQRWQQVLWWSSVEQVDREALAERLGTTAQAAGAVAHRARQAFAAAYLAEHLGVTTDPGCVRVLPKVIRLVRGTASPSMTAAVEHHLASCASCRTVSNDLADLNSSLRSVPAPVAAGVVLGWWSLGAVAKVITFVGLLVTPFTPVTTNVADTRERSVVPIISAVDPVDFWPGSLVAPSTVSEASASVVAATTTEVGGDAFVDPLAASLDPSARATAIPAATVPVAGSVPVASVRPGVPATAPTSGSTASSTSSTVGAATAAIVAPPDLTTPLGVRGVPVTAADLVPMLPGSASVLPTLLWSTRFDVIVEGLGDPTISIVDEMTASVPVPNAVAGAVVPVDLGGVQPVPVASVGQRPGAVPSTSSPVSSVAPVDSFGVG